MDDSRLKNVIEWAILIVVPFFIIVALVVGLDQRKKMIAFQKRIADDVLDLREACRSIGSDNISIRGKVLILVDDSGEYISGVKLPRGLDFASASDSEFTVLMEDGPFYKDVTHPTDRYTDMCVVYWPEKKVVGKASLRARGPSGCAQWRRGVEPVTKCSDWGEDTNEVIANWLARLPRVN